MPKPNVPDNLPVAEAGLLNNNADVFFDHAVKAAANHLGTEVSAIAMFDPNADWLYFKSQQGLAEPWASEGGMARSESICQHLLQQNAALVIPDTRNHHLLQDTNVAETMGIIAYLGAPIRSPSGDVIGSIFVLGAKPRAWDVLEIASLTDLARCISEYVALKMDTLQLRRQIGEATARQRAAIDMLADTSHELRSPLNALLGVAGALGQTELTDRQRGMLALMDQAGDQLRHLADNLLAMAQGEDATPLERDEPAFHPSMTIRSAIELVRAGIVNKSASLRVEDAVGEETAVFGNEAHVRQVLGNLLENALAFNPEGPVQVRQSLARLEGEAAILTLTVSDSGPGVPEGIREAIFNRFRRGEHSPAGKQPGTGLGLTIARKLCRQHGGDLRVEDTPGGGATFIATFTVRPRLSQD